MPTLLPQKALDALDESCLCDLRLNAARDGDSCFVGDNGESVDTEGLEGDGFDVMVAIQQKKKDKKVGFKHGRVRPLHILHIYVNQIYRHYITPWCQNSPVYSYSVK